MEHLGPLLVLGLLALSVLLFYFVLSLASGSLQRVGLTRGQASAIIAGTFIGGFVNLPIGELGGWRLAVNVGGAIVPVVLSLALIQRNRLPANELLVGLLLVTGVSFLVTRFDPELGVVSPFPLWLLPAATGMLVASAAWWHERKDSAALAYVAGSLGTLVGADLLRLPQIASSEPVGENLLSIGGAAIFDMVFLTGIIAVGMQGSLLARLGQSPTQEGSRIDREYEEWVERKREEQEDYEKRRVGGPRRAPPPSGPARAAGGATPGSRAAPRAPPPFLPNRSRSRNP